MVAQLLLLLHLLWLMRKPLLLPLLLDEMLVLTLMRMFAVILSAWELLGRDQAIRLPIGQQCLNCMQRCMAAPLHEHEQQRCTFSR